MSATHLVGAAPSLPRRLLAPLLWLPMLPRTQPGLSLASAARGGNREGPTHCAPPCWGGTTLRQGPEALHPTPSLLPVVPPFNHSTITPRCWAGRPLLGAGTVLGSDGGLLSDGKGWAPVVRTQTSGCPILSFSPRPAHSPRQSPTPMSPPPHLPPLLGELPTLPGHSGFSSSDVRERQRLTAAAAAAADMEREGGGFVEEVMRRRRSPDGGGSRGA